MLSEVRQHGIARVMNALLPGVVGFCAPVFDSDGHLALGMLSLGPPRVLMPHGLANPPRHSSKLRSNCRAN